MEIKILFDCAIVTLLSIAFLVSLGILVLIFVRLRPLSNNTPVLLIVNTYTTLLLTCIAMLIVYIYNLTGDLHPFVSINNPWCQLRTYFVNISFCSLYYSCVLQSIFRLFRIVFYNIKILQSSYFFLLTIVIQWFISFVLISINLVNNDYQHLPFIYRCWITFENTHGLLFTASIIYGIPLITIVWIYTYTVRHIGQHTQLQQKREKIMQRDSLILKRITIFVFVITTSSLPTMLILFIRIGSNVFIPMAYYIQGLSMSVGLLIASVCFAFISPQIQNIFTKKQAVSMRSSITVRSNRHSKLSQKETHETI